MKSNLAPQMRLFEEGWSDAVNFAQGVNFDPTYHWEADKIIFPTIYNMSLYKSLYIYIFRPNSTEPDSNIFLIKKNFSYYAIYATCYILSTEFLENG